MLRKLLSLACVGLCLSCASVLNAAQLELDFTQAPNATLQFSGSNTFSFLPSGGNDIQITSPGSAHNLFGTISGTFNIGNINTVPGLDFANVTGNGSDTLSIADGSGHTLTASISFPALITTSGTAAPFSGLFNFSLSGVSYNGTNAQLMALANGTMPSGFVNFSSPKALPQLASGNTTTLNAFTGSVVAAVPEPGSMVLALAAAPALGGFWLRRRRKAAV